MVNKYSSANLSCEISGLSRVTYVRTSRTAWVATSPVCMLDFQACFILFLGVCRRNEGAQHPVRELCLLEDGHWPSFALVEEVGEFKGK